MAGTNVTELVDVMKGVEKTKLSLAERIELASAARSLIAEVERPWDTILRIGFGEPAIHACIRTLIDLKLSERWIEAGGKDKSPKALGEMDLWKEPDKLTARILRTMASAELVANPAPDVYRLTDFSRSLADETVSATFRYMHHFNLPVYASMPSYLAHEGFRDISGRPVTSTMFNWSKCYKGDFFSYLTEHPNHNEDFGNMMKGFTSSKTRWTDQYPTEKLLEGVDDGVVVVDIGGGIGHDLNVFQEKYKLPPGKLILQDLPEVIEKAKVVDGITTISHNFLTPQPVKGARAYYLHSVFHDWPDHKAREILECLKPALGKGYSKVLLHEMIIWPQGNAPYVTHADLLMMALFNAGERTIEMWRQVIEPAGFKIVEVYTSPTSPQSILELDLACIQVA